MALACPALAVAALASASAAVALASAAAALPSASATLASASATLASASAALASAAPALEFDLSAASCASSLASNAAASVALALAASASAASASAANLAGALAASASPGGLLFRVRTRLHRQTAALLYSCVSRGDRCLPLRQGLRRHHVGGVEGIAQLRHVRLCHLAPPRKFVPLSLNSLNSREHCIALERVGSLRG